MSETPYGLSEFFFKQQSFTRDADNAIRALDLGLATEASASVQAFSGRQAAKIRSLYGEQRAFLPTLTTASRFVDHLVRRERRSPFLDGYDKNLPFVLLSPAVAMIGEKVSELPPEGVVHFDLYAQPLMQLIDLSHDESFKMHSGLMGSAAMEVLVDKVLPRIHDYMQDRGLEDGDSWPPSGKARVLPVIEKILTHGNNEQKEKAKQVIASYLEKDDPYGEIVPFREEVLSSKVPDLYGVAFPQAQRELAQCGWSWEEVIDDWKASCSEAMLGNIVGRNIEAIKALETEETGCTKVLSERFGIKCFGRYPKELLLRQYHERNNAYISYGIVINPRRADPKGTLYQKIYERMYTSLIDQFLSAAFPREPRFGIRVTEGSEHDIEERLTAFPQRYGSKKKIAFGIISGHSDGWGVRLDDGYSLEMRHIAELFSHKDIVLNACYSGIDQGVAQQMSAFTDGRVHTSADSSNLNYVRLGPGDDGLLELVATFVDVEGHTVPTVTYLAGAKVS
ncbi:MAG: hypothetical protein AAB553_06925 [Patescibacteria group bacterium]